MNIDDLQELEEESVKRGIPIIGSSKGQWLLGRVQAQRPRQILELGTANGYSGCILGSEGAELTTVEQNEAIAKEAKSNLTRYNINARIVVGNAVSVVQQMVRDENNYELFDLIFIDFAKQQYIEVLQNCVTLLRPGGLIIADNLTMSGCREFKDAIIKHPQLKTEFIDIDDGLSCSEKVE